MSNSPYRYIINPDTGCWEWQGKPSRCGYGLRYWQGSAQLAHRLAFAEANGPIPDNHVIHHICGNRLCVNPEHLVAQKREDHIAGHWAEKRGQAVRCPRSKGNGALAHLIDEYNRTKRQEGEPVMTQKRLAELAGVRPETVTRHVKGHTGMSDETQAAYRRILRMEAEVTA